VLGRRSLPVPEPAEGVTDDLEEVTVATPPEKFAAVFWGRVA
jgi:hypothetical protein